MEFSKSCKKILKKFQKVDLGDHQKLRKVDFEELVGGVQ
jgi:hypothetical protein